MKDFMQNFLEKRALETSVPIKAVLPLYTQEDTVAEQLSKMRALIVFGHSKVAEIHTQIFSERASRCLEKELNYARASTTNAVSIIRNCTETIELIAPALPSKTAQTLAEEALKLREALMFHAVMEEHLSTVVSALKDFDRLLVELLQCLEPTLRNLPACADRGVAVESFPRSLSQISPQPEDIDDLFLG